MNPALRRTVLCLCLWALPASGALPGTVLLRQDFQRLYRPASLGLMVTAMAGAALAHPWDDQVKGPLVDEAVLKRLLDLGNIYGASLNALGAATGIWIVARATNHPLLQATASDLVRSLLLASSMVVPLKQVTGRWRPDHRDRRSFPSGHSANAFAMSTALARRYGMRAGVPLYALAGLAPLARIHYRHHYLSDVVAGGVLGLAAGWAVTEQGARVAWLPAGPAGGWGIELRIASK
ncbi:MAG: phosphatase PAP2 family protein [Candidatus Latescibacteria bacterium]|nr:phosphatase PAP2 family protein [Candidatus Latescibacterota bacterium]